MPWRALRSRPVLVHLDGVSLTVGAREEADWEEGPAAKRASAAKLAQLAAFELQQMSSSVGGDLSQTGNRKSGWPLLSYLSSFLRNKLELSVSNVNLSFRVSQPSRCITTQIAGVSANHCCFANPDC